MLALLAAHNSKRASARKGQPSRRSCPRLRKLHWCNASCARATAQTVAIVRPSANAQHASPPTSLLCTQMSVAEGQHLSLQYPAVALGPAESIDTHQDSPKDHVPTCQASCRAEATVRVVVMVVGKHADYHRPSTAVEVRRWAHSRSFRARSNPRSTCPCSNPRHKTLCCARDLHRQHTHKSLQRARLSSMCWWLSAVTGAPRRGNATSEV